MGLDRKKDRVERNQGWGNLCLWYSWCSVRRIL